MTVRTGDKTEMDKKSNVIQEYIQKGGLEGYALSMLAEEFKKAEHDKAHVLSPIVSLQRKNLVDEAASLLWKLLLNADEGSPLMPMATHIRACVVEEAVKHAVKNADNSDSLESLPPQVLLWAGMDLGLKESKAAGGRNKGKVWKEKIIAAWEKSNKKSIPAFAKRFFQLNGGTHDQNGNKLGKAPSVSTIERCIRKHEYK